MVNKALPKVAATTHPGDGSLVFVMRNRPGYYEKETLGVVDDGLTPDKWNQAHGITKPEEAALRGGSMFGWNTPAADPDSYDDEGRLIVKIGLV